MKILSPMFIALLQASCEALRIQSREFEEPCANTIDVSITHGKVAPLAVRSLPLNDSFIPLSDQMANNINLSVFWTLGPGTHTQDVVDEQLLALQASQLADHANAIYVWGQDYNSQKDIHDLGRNYAECFAGHDDIWEKIQDVPLPSSAKEWWGEQDHTFEFPTLEGLWDFCSTAKNNGRDDFVLYMHTKASTKSDEGLYNAESNWRLVMQHFVVNEYRDCVEHLKNGFATCGANLEKRPGGATWPHYSGNFWWARCDYIRQLSNPRPSKEDLLGGGTPYSEKPSGRWLAEWWVLSGNDAFKSSHKNCWGTPSQFTEGGVNGCQGCRGMYLGESRMPKCL